MNKKFRRAEKKDIEKIIELLFKLTSYEREIISLEPPQMNEVSSRVNLDFVYKTDLEYFVCEIENEIVGVIRIEKFLNEGKISEAYVEKKWRKKGIMNKLFEMCVEWAKINGVTEFYLTVVEGNELAYNFWVNLGFFKSELRSKIITLRRKVNNDIVK